MSSLGLPAPQQAIQLGRDPGLVSGLGNLGRNIQATNFAQQEMDLKKKQVEGSAMQRLIDLNKERRMGIKQQFDLAKEEAENLHEQLMTLPEDEGIKLIEQIYSDPQKSEFAKRLAPTPEALYKRIVGEKAKEDEGTLKFKADLAKSFDGVETYLKSKDINDLKVKTDASVSIDSATEIVKSLRQAHRVETNAMMKQLDFASPEEKQQILNQINTLNTAMVNKTKELFSTTLNKSGAVKATEGSTLNTQGIIDNLFDSVQTYSNVAELEADLNSKEASELFEQKGIKLEEIKPLLLMHYDNIKALEIDMQKIGGIGEQTPGQNVLGQ